MDYVRYFGGEAAAFEAAARKAAGPGAAPPVPSCPGWVMTDLVLHLGVMHRFLARVIGERMRQPPDASDPRGMGVPDDWAAWLPPGRAPSESAVPAALLDWFHEGAEALEERLFLASPDEPVWSWSADRTVGFWQRMETIETAVHRWDAQQAVGAPEPLDSALAADAVGLTLELLIPRQRATAKAPPGRGERYRLRRTDGAGAWTVCFSGDEVLLGPAGDRGDSETARPDTETARPDIEIAGRASDLALFLWKRPVTGQLDIQGNTRMIRRYFDLVPSL